MYVVSGGGGGTIDTERVAYWPFVTAEFSMYHFGLMTVNDNTLAWEVFGVNNQLLDSFVLTSRVPKISETTASGGSLRLVVAGKPGTTYVIESSPDLAVWTPAATNTIPLGASPGFTNTFAIGSGAKFFRPRTAN